jgi:hypothetical protein
MIEGGDGTYKKVEPSSLSKSTRFDTDRSLLYLEASNVLYGPGGFLFLKAL